MKQFKLSNISKFKLSALCFCLCLTFISSSLAAEAISCSTCSSESDFRHGAIGKAYDIGQSMPAGVYYPWIYVINFNSGIVKKYEVMLEVNSSSSDPFPTIYDVSASISAELSVPSAIAQDVSMAKDIADTIQDIDIHYPPIFYYFGGENVFDFLGDQNAYNDMEDAYNSQLRDAAGWLNFSSLWAQSMALEFSSFLTPFQAVATVEFRDGGFIRFFLTPQLTQGGEVMGFTLEFKAAFDADGNEVFEDPEIYLGDTFITELGENWGSSLPTVGEVPLLAYLNSIGYSVPIVDGRGAFGCFRTIVVTECTRAPDNDLECRAKVQCQ